MKTIGLIGGMSWQSTLEYYRIINELVCKRLGDLSSAKIIMYSVNFEEVLELMRNGKWQELTDLMVEIARKLERCGAEVILICTNTMHKIADDVQRRIGVPVLNIIDVTAERIRERGLKRVGLLGTRFTMEEDFYTKRMKKHGIEVIVPEKDEIDIIHNIIIRELCLGIIKDDSKRVFKKIIHNLVSKGSEGIVLGCTEIPLLIKQEDFSVPLFDTTRIHAEAAVDFALQEV